VKTLPVGSQATGPGTKAQVGITPTGCGLEAEFPPNDLLVVTEDHQFSFSA